MEHEVLRKLGEPRIHFAIVCASIGCPRLLSEAYEAKSLDAQLTLNAKDFFADQTKFSFDANRKKVGLSPILQWFATDFGKTKADQLKFVSRFAPVAAKEVVLDSKTQVKYLDYDWNLNDQD